MSVLNDHLKLVCSPVCLLLFLSCGLLFPLPHSLFSLSPACISPAALQWTSCTEKRRWNVSWRRPLRCPRWVWGELCMWERCIAPINHTMAFCFSPALITLSVTHSDSFLCCLLPLLSINWCYQLSWLLASIVFASLLHWPPGSFWAPGPSKGPYLGVEDYTHMPISNLQSSKSKPVNGGLTWNIFEVFETVTHVFVGSVLQYIGKWLNWWPSPLI